MKSLSDISEILQSKKTHLFKTYGIDKLAIFGSYAREVQNITSDVDILVEFRNPIGIEFIDLADELEAILGIKVDLVSKNGIKLKYLKSIEPELVYV